LEKKQFLENKWQPLGNKSSVKPKTAPKTPLQPSTGEWRKTPLQEINILLEKKKKKNNKVRVVG
jgi:hypothetical protein